MVTTAPALLLLPPGMQPVQRNQPRQNQQRDNNNRQDRNQQPARSLRPLRPQLPVEVAAEMIDTFFSTSVGTSLP